MKVLGIFFACLLVNEIYGFSDRMCGAKLTQIMWIVCENGFNSMIDKRSDHTNSIIPGIESDVPYPLPSSSLSNIFQVEQGNLLAKTRRIRMLGIADECCKKASVNQIQVFADRRCGAQLTQIMWAICENGFNTIPMSKRSVHSHQLLSDIEDNLPYPYAANSLSNIFQLEKENLIGKNRRTRMLGIVDECCKKSCTYNELAAYCLP
ncbi:putative insulin-like peptide 1 [Lucilia cuprina]|nr:putative insulin-like peptide 1 [Lucilia cuprina]